MVAINSPARIRCDDGDNDQNDTAVKLGDYSHIHNGDMCHAEHINSCLIRPYVDPLSNHLSGRHPCPIPTFAPELDGSCVSDSTHPFVRVSLLHASYEYLYFPLY